MLPRAAVGNHNNKFQSEVIETSKVHETNALWYALQMFFPYIWSRREAHHRLLQWRTTLKSWLRCDPKRAIKYLVIASLEVVLDYFAWLEQFITRSFFGMRPTFLFNERSVLIEIKTWSPWWLRIDQALSGIVSSSLLVAICQLGHFCSPGANIYPFLSTETARNC